MKINEPENKRISKFLSLVLRHSPQTIYIKLDKNGWANVDELIKNTNHYAKINLTFEILKEIVTTNDKQRFSFNSDYSKIRASQGHSVSIDLGYAPAEPPIVLYHGTAKDNLGSILQNGLHKMGRHHVHLSVDIKIAFNVGKRHGKPVIFEVNSKQMNIDKYIFYLSENLVWLTEHIPPHYLKIVDLK